MGLYPSRKCPLGLWEQPQGLRAPAPVWAGPVQGRGTRWAEASHGRGLAQRAPTLAAQPGSPPPMKTRAVLEMKTVPSFCVTAGD